ncbi:recombinase family protein [Brooklawnia propionicigenes]|uniref:Recombinase family protein n=1 Tax=Brooklawnia propionicigenes TaxID=3041175 RepID=A0AAN0K6F0_9ACTN|nr:recombinase family protein [Brooklawnia sp. SH051]BEH01727.1 recombinase family protein [Brooklawnia sp. SH051]
MRLLGYTRVTDNRSAAIQLDALTSAGVKSPNIFSDVTTAARETTDRPGMRRLTDNAEEGDTVVVWQVDRLGRSLSEALETVTLLVERGIGVCSLQDGIDPGTVDGRQMLNLLVRLAEYERNVKGERIAAGMAAARESGTRLGRPPVDSVVIRNKIRAVEEARARGMTAGDAAQLVGWSRATFYRHQQEHGSQQ